MTRLIVERRRTGWDIVLGVLLIMASFVILGHTVLATVVSVVFLGWVTLFSGVVALVAALFRIGKGFWSTALSGGLLTVLGLLLLRNPAAAALALTLAAGSLFLVSGLTRLVGAFENDAYRSALLVGGVVSTILGLLVLFKPAGGEPHAAGCAARGAGPDRRVTLLLVGRVRVTEVPAGYPRRQNGAAVTPHAMRLRASPAGSPRAGGLLSQPAGSVRRVGLRGSCSAVIVFR